MISIIIPTFKGENKIGKTLEGILKQAPEKIEVIVVSDGPSGNTKNVIESYRDSFLANGYRLVFLEKEWGGAPSARNRGLGEAGGEYLFFSDDDAVLRAGALEEMRKVLEANPDKSYVYPSHYFGGKLFKSFPFDAARLRKMPYIHTMALVRRKDFPAVGWDEKIVKFQDWDLWLTMLENGKEGIWIDKVLFDVSGGGVYSSWLPSFAYKLLPFLPSVKKYNQAMAVIKNKHHLD